MKIKHEKWGVVEGVQWYYQSTGDHYNIWTINGATYHQSQGWSLVKEDKWEDITGECEINELGSIIHDGGYTMFDTGYRRFLTHMYDLPEDWKEQWVPHWLPNRKTLEDHVKSFKKPCIIVERKVD